jgi:hypothetical protein
MLRSNSVASAIDCEAVPVCSCSRRLRAPADEQKKVTRQKLDAAHEGTNLI